MRQMISEKKNTAEKLSGINSIQSSPDRLNQQDYWYAIDCYYAPMNNQISINFPTAISRANRQYT